MRKLLLVSYWIGILADALATVILFSPAVAKIVFQPRTFELSANYLYVSRIAGALMLGWTVLLFWAQLKPVERADILLITLFPVVTLLAAAAVLVVQAQEIALSKLLPMFVFYLVVYCTFVPSFVWAKRQVSHAAKHSL
jgi:hypothetical protein